MSLKDYPNIQEVADDMVPVDTSTPDDASEPDHSVSMSPELYGQYLDKLASQSADSTPIPPSSIPEATPDSPTNEMTPEMYQAYIKAMINGDELVPPNASKEEEKLKDDSEFDPEHPKDYERFLASLPNSSKENEQSENGNGGGLGALVGNESGDEKSPDLKAAQLGALLGNDESDNADPLAPTAPGSPSGLGSLKPTLPGMGGVPSRHMAGEMEAPPEGAQPPPAPGMPMAQVPPNPSQYNTVEGLKAAQDKADALRRQAYFYGGLDKITAGLNHAKPVMEPFYAQEIKDSNRPVQDYTQLGAQEKLDPNSAVSQGFRDYAKKFGVNVPNSFSAADAEKVMPYAIKAYEADQNRQATQNILGQKQDEAQKMLAYKYKELNAMQNDRLDAKRDLASEAANKKQGDSQDKAYTEMRQKLETFRGNQGAQQASKDILTADKALQIVGGKDPNSLTVQDLHLLADEMSKLATGGVSSESGVKALLPNNLQQKVAEMQNFLSSSPTDAQAGEYIKRNMQYLKDIKSVAQNNMNQFRANIAQGYKNRVKPEDYHEALGDYGINPGGPTQQAQPQAQALGKDDQQAIQWAKEHSSDPRAQKILQLHGMQ
jgi:hypothetical protein